MDPVEKSKENDVQMRVLYTDIKGAFCMAYVFYRAILGSSVKMTQPHYKRVGGHRVAKTANNNKEKKKKKRERKWATKEARETAM